MYVRTHNDEIYAHKRPEHYMKCRPARTSSTLQEKSPKSQYPVLFYFDVTFPVKRKDTEKKIYSSIFHLNRLFKNMYFLFRMTLF